MSLARVIRSAARAPKPFVLLEGVLGVLLVALVNRLWFPFSPGFHGWAANPYALPVLLAACRYGLLSGLFTALLASTAHIGSILLATTGLEGAVLLTSTHLGTPVLLCLIGVVGGHLADRRRDQLAQAVAALDRSELHRERLSTQYTLLLDEKHLLDKQVLGSDEVFDVLARMARTSTKLRKGQFPARILRLALKLLGGGTAALYGVVRAKKLEGDVGVLVRATDGSWARGLSSKHPVFREALGRSESVSLPQVAGWADAATFAAEQVHVACGLEATWSGRRLVLVARGVPFHAFSPARLRALTAAMRLVSRALSRTQKLAQLETSEEDAALSRASSRAYFEARLDAELAEAGRRASKVRLVKLRLLPVVGPAAGRALRSRLRARIQPLVSAGQLVAHGERGGGFTLLCPLSGAQNPDGVAAMLLDEVRALSAKDDAMPRPDDVAITVLELDPRDADGGDGG